MSAGRAPGLAFLVGTLLAAQTFGTLATMTLPAVAPKVAATYGISASLIGYQISLLAAFMLVSLTFGSRLSARWGACRVTQYALLLLAAGCLTATLPHVVFVFASAVVLGLGYGLLSPPSSQLLARFTPLARRNLIFSLKQTGVPLGGILAAAITPAVALSLGWQWALAGSALVLCGLVGLMQRARPHWDDDRDPAAKVAISPFAGIAIVWNQLALRLLSVSGGCFVVVQVCLQTFTVVLFVEQIGIGLITAGIVLTASQVGGVFGRVFWGWLADVTRSCFGVLSVLAGVMLATCLLVLALKPAWPIAVACALFFVLGSTASGWNGAFLAEVARLAPRREIPAATGGSLFVVNVGKMIGPIAFTNAYLLSGSYTLVFGLLALPAAIGLGCVLAAHQLGARVELPAAAK
ncbi:MAG: MFS transporter [Betaproteobacteria bacterium]|nr:MFS transporter [Betaproteobacteria bacterium]